MTDGKLPRRGVHTPAVAAAVRLYERLLVAGPGRAGVLADRINRRLLDLTPRELAAYYAAAADARRRRAGQGQG